MLSAKNLMMSPAASDLGLGDMLGQQLSDQEAERKKKLLGLNNAQTNRYGDAMLNSPASMDLLGGMK